MRNTLSTPSNARRTVAGSSRLPWTAVTPAAAFSLEGSRARPLTGTPLPASPFTTADPTVPVPPVTRMLIKSSSRPSRGAATGSHNGACCAHIAASTLDAIAPGEQELAHALAQIALQLHTFVGRRTARAARALQLLGQIPQERAVVRQTEHDRHRFSAAPLLLHAQLRDRTIRHGLARGLPAPAAAPGLAAAPANLSRAARIDDPAVLAILPAVARSGVNY